MRSISRHFIATVLCVTLFTLIGTLDGFQRVLYSVPSPNASASLLFSGLLNFIFVSILSLMVLTPVSSLGEYLFTKKWLLPSYVQFAAILPLMIVYLTPWSLLFGNRFEIILVAATVSLTLPLLCYWAIFRLLDREFVT